MSYVFNFPDIGEGLTEGKLLEWYVRVGQELKEGDLVAKVDTDKVVADIPVPRGGRVLKLHGEPGQVIYVNQPLVELDTGNGETTAGPPEKAGMDESARGAAAVEPGAEPQQGFGVVGSLEVASGSEVMPASGEGLEASITAPPKARAGKVRATPVARRMARELGVDIGTLKGTGPGGRVMKKDIRLAADSAAALPPSHAGRTAATGGESAAPEAPATEDALPPRGGTELLELSQLRKTVAARMAQSKGSVPHATTFEEVEVSRLRALREEQRERLAARGIRLSWMPFVCRAVAVCLRRNPKLNCRLEIEQGRAVLQHFVNLGIAVDTPEGLIVPVIRDADLLSVRQLAETIADLAERARRRELALEELKGGTFTITNYGSIAGIHGAPIINPPEAAILGVGRVMDRAVVRDGELRPGVLLPLSLAVDHRIVDGGDAARFLRDLMDLLADPVAMLID